MSTSDGSAGPTQRSAHALAGSAQSRRQLHRFDASHRLEAVLLSAPDTAPATSCPPGQTKVGDEGGQFVKALSEAEPGRAVVRKEESGPVRELEVRTQSS